MHSLRSTKRGPLIATHGQSFFPAQRISVSSAIGEPYSATQHDTLHSAFGVANMPTNHESLSAAECPPVLAAFCVAFYTAIRSSHHSAIKEPHMSTFIPTLRQAFDGPCGETVFPAERESQHSAQLFA